MGEKRCPFITVSNVIFEYYKDRCALWTNGRCAIVAIAENLKEQKKARQ